MSTIENGLRADVMRQRMEDKNSLDKNFIYIGTGNSETLDGVTIKETKGIDLMTAINDPDNNGVQKIQVGEKNYTFAVSTSTTGGIEGVITFVVES